jgi:hypothetical protein
MADSCGGSVGFQLVDEGDDGVGGPVGGGRFPSGMTERKASARANAKAKARAKANAGISPLRFASVEMTSLCVCLVGDL